MLVIGDQLLTDVLGAKRMGFTVLWVRSLQGKEFPMTRITRQIEKMLVRRLDAQLIAGGKKMKVALIQMEIAEKNTPGNIVHGLTYCRSCC